MSEIDDQDKDDLMPDTPMPYLLKCLVARVGGAKLKTVRLTLLLAPCLAEAEVARRFGGLVEQLFINGYQVDIGN
jgi:hypothetical protein